MGRRRIIVVCLGFLGMFLGCDSSDSSDEMSTMAPNQMMPSADTDRFQGDIKACPMGFSEAPATGQHTDYAVGEQKRSFTFIYPVWTI